MIGEDTLYLPATELGRQIRARKLSSVEATRVYLDRLNSTGRKLNALAELARDHALAEAAAMDRELTAGRTRTPGPGAGVGPAPGPGGAESAGEVGAAGQYRVAGRRDGG